MVDPLAELRHRHLAAEEGGGPERRERQHRAGKLSARERVDLLLDEGTLETKVDTTPRKKHGSIPL